MRFSWKTLVVAAAAVLVVPQFATADDVQVQLEQMQDRLNQLEDKLQATNDELEDSNTRVADQQKLIQKAGLEDERSGQSGLSKFLEMTEFSGFIAASWNYNFNKPTDTAVGFSQGGGRDTVNGLNASRGGWTAPVHSNPNSFQLDQLWFSMEKKVDGREPWPASRCRHPVRCGKTADNLPPGTFNSMRTTTPATRKAAPTRTAATLLCTSTRPTSRVLWRRSVQRR